MSLRTNPELNRHVHAVSGRVEDQVAWTRSYFQRPGDYYWLVESAGTHEPHGTIGLYDISEAHGTGEFGRWILRPGSLAALESAWLLFRAAFERLNLGLVYCRTLVTNDAVVSFHDSLGMRRHTRITALAEIRGVSIDAIEHRLTREDWTPIESKLRLRLERLARTIQRRSGE